MNQTNAFVLGGKPVKLEAGDVISYAQGQLSFTRNGEMIGIQFQRQKTQVAEAIEMHMPNIDSFIAVCNLLAANGGFKTERYKDNPSQIQLVAP